MFTFCSKHKHTQTGEQIEDFGRIFSKVHKREFLDDAVSPIQDFSSSRFYLLFDNIPMYLCCILFFYLLSPPPLSFELCEYLSCFVGVCSSPSGICSVLLIPTFFFLNSLATIAAIVNEE